MPRPKRLRKIAFDPTVTYFKPRGIPLSELKEVDIGLDELEAVRLKYVDIMNNEQASKVMKVSSSTFQRLTASALEKIVGGIVDGKALKIHKTINIP